MTDQGPYRQPDGLACPTCAAVLLARESGERACPKGCGEWVAASLAEQRWGRAVTIDGDPRLKWRVAAASLACPVCKAKATRVVHDGWQSFRCADHGVWFVRDARGRFERTCAAAIAEHRAVLERAEAAIAMIRGAVGGDAAAVAALAARLLALEGEVAQLRATVQTLAGLPRG